MQHFHGHTMLTSWFPSKIKQLVGLQSKSNNKMTKKASVLAPGNFSNNVNGKDSSGMRNLQDF
jgi:hypothetical protein